MKQGLMWCEEAEPATAIGNAVKHYLEKHGEMPTLCHTNPDCTLVEVGAIGLMGLSWEVRVIQSQRIPPHHYWIGLADDSEADDTEREEVHSDGQQRRRDHAKKDQMGTEVHVQVREGAT